MKKPTYIPQSLINRVRTLVVNIHIVCLQSCNSRNRSQENDREVIVATTEL